MAWAARKTSTAKGEAVQAKGKAVQAKGKAVLKKPGHRVAGVRQHETGVGPDEPAGLINHVKRRKASVEVVYSDSHGMAQEAFELVVIACNPSELQASGAISLTSDEAQLYGSFKNFTFQTTLYEFPAVDKRLHSQRFNPGAVSRMDGSLYGYRSETRKAFQGLPDDVTIEYVTLYQLLDPEKHGEQNQSDLDRKLNQQISSGEGEWFPYDLEKGRILKQFHTKYFNHFGVGDTSLLWDIFERQGQNKTLLVHASACFESVLHIWQYIESLMDQKRMVLPEDKTAAIAVLGAGPSGLLATRKLEAMGYTHITVLERGPKEDHGKTVTCLYTQESHGKVVQVPCELGTCYLSPAYDTMMKDLADLTHRNTRIDFQNDTETAPFFGIVTDGQFDKSEALGRPFGGPVGQVPLVVDFESYLRLKGLEETASDSSTPEELKEQLAGMDMSFVQDIRTYCLTHQSLFGKERPIPLDPCNRRQLQKLIGEKTTIEDFVKTNKLTSLTGFLQYAYSIQGYGALQSDMSFMYLLMWITPEFILPFIENNFKLAARAAMTERQSELLSEFDFDCFKKKGLVTGFEKGWSDVWRQLTKKFESNAHVTLKYGVDVKKITRQALAPERMEEGSAEAACKRGRELYEAAKKPMVERARKRARKDAEREAAAEATARPKSRG